MILKDNVFRANVGAIVINSKGEVLAFERSKIKNAWQFIQGGLDEEEETLEAIYREVLEESGINKDQIELIEEYPGWLAYELDKAMMTPKTGRGQVQKWFLFKLKSDDIKIDLDKVTDKEFSSYKYMKFDELIDIVIHFRKDVYKQLKVYWDKNFM